MKLIKKKIKESLLTYIAIYCECKEKQWKSNVEAKYYEEKLIRFYDIGKIKI